MRVVIATNQYRLCRVVKICTCDETYTVQSGSGAKNQAIETKQELHCQFGKLYKVVKLTMISNSKASEGEFNAFKNATVAANQKQLTKQYSSLKRKQLNQLMSGKISQDQVEEIMRRRLELKVKEGLYNQIPNIPRVISKLTAEIDTLTEQVAKVPKRDWKLAETIKKKLDRNTWLISQLNSHREIEVKDIKRETGTHGDQADIKMQDETDEAVQQRRELMCINDVVKRF